MRNITTEAWRQHPADRPAMSGILRRMMTKSDVQWSADQLRTAENEARKKLTDALRVSTRVRTPRREPVSAGLSSGEGSGLSPREAANTRHGEQRISPQSTRLSPRVSQVSPGVSRVSPRVSRMPQRGAGLQTSRKQTPVTKQGGHKENSNGKSKPSGSHVDDQEKIKSSESHVSGSASVRENASSSGSVREVNSSHIGNNRCSAQTLTRDEGFSESSFTDDQMSHDGSQCESGAAGGQSADEPSEAAEEPSEAAEEVAEALAGLAQVHLDFPERPAKLLTDHESGVNAKEEDAGHQLSSNMATPCPQPDQQQVGFSTTHDQTDPTNRDACQGRHGETEDEFEDESAEPVTVQYRGKLQPDPSLDVQSEAQQSTRTDAQSDTTETYRDEDHISSSFDSDDETSVKVPMGERIERPNSDLMAEDGDNDGLGVDSTTQHQSQTLSSEQTLQHQSEIISQGVTDQHLNEAGPVGDVGLQTAETAQQEQNTSAAGEVVTAMAQPRADPQVPSYPAVIFYDEADPDIAQVMQVAQLLRRTWGLHVFDPHRDGVEDKMTSFRHSFENSQHAVAVLTPAVIRDMQENRPSTASFRIATFLTGLLETREQTCRRRLIPVQIGNDEIPFILCNFCVLRLGTSGFHRRLYRAVGSQTGDTGLTTRDVRGWADQMPLLEHTVNTVAAMLRLPPEVLTDIKQEFGGSRARLIQVLECWCMHHGACATDVRLQQVVAAVTGGQRSCARDQEQVQANVPEGQGSCTRDEGLVQATVPDDQGSDVRGQSQVQAAVPGGQGETQRQQYEEHQPPAEINTLLRTNRVRLVDALMYPEPVLDHLYSRCVINNEEMELIKSHSVRHEQARKLLDIIATKGTWGCAELKSVLAEVNPYAATFLET
ncbi:uncharacterized protein LOC118412532 [Branchiostoma floridae]|uniref:Uncharacterized protein LOC118412532 n=1 Tax=Branchiostoma floridae TaxID=7739 RepID=A0A9J7KXE0_BRAFL|nr:uncharacterized protein LOC118412532 [Branchiostoma floridae]